MAKTTNMSATKDRYFYLWQVYVYQHWQAFSILELLTFSLTKVGLQAAQQRVTKPWFVFCPFWTSWPAQHDSGQHSQQRKEWKPVSGDSGWHAGQPLWPARHGALHNGQGSWNIRNTQRETDRDLWLSHVMGCMSISANQRPNNKVVQPIRGLNFFRRYNNQSQRSLGLRQLSISQCFIKCIQISEPWGKRRLVGLWESIFGPFEMSKGRRSKRINSWLGYVSWSFLALVPGLVWWGLSEISSFRCIKKDCVSTL